MRSSQNWMRRLLFAFLLLTACPVVNLILRRNNLNDLWFWGVMFLPGIIVTLLYLITNLGLWLFLKKKHKTYFILDGVVFAILLISLFSPIPNLHAELSRHNDEIKPKIRNNIHVLNTKIIESIGNNEPSIMYDLFVDEVKAEGIDNIKKLYSQFSPAIEGIIFEVYNEYYVVLQSWRAVQFTVQSETVADGEFYMNLKTASNSTYIALLRSEGNFQDCIFSFVYVKVNRKWRLHKVHLGIFKIGGKTTTEWHQEAKELSEKGHNIPAFLRQSIANQILRPAPFIQYAQEKEITALFNDIQKKVYEKYKFPIQLSNVKNAPEIYYIEPQFVQMDLLPMIKYITKVPLDNVPELEEEVEAITAELESVFPGITKNVSHIAYKAFSEPPTDPKKTYQNYGLTVEIK